MVLVDVARAKVRFEQASRGRISQFAAELENISQSPGHEPSRLLATENRDNLSPPVSGFCPMKRATVFASEPKFE